MKIGVPRALIVALAALFSGYHLLLAAYSLAFPFASERVPVIVAMVLTAIAGALLALQIAPRQHEALDSPDDGSQLRRLAMLTGIFNLLWAVVVVLMIVRPGSSYP